MTGSFTQYTYEWLTVDPVTVGVRIPEQPPLPPIVEPKSLPPVEAPDDEPMVQVADCDIQLPAPYWQVGWRGAVAGTFLRADVARRLVGVANGLPEPFGLAVLDGWRPLELQRQIYHAAYQNSTLPPGFVSEPSTDPRNPPPHLTGGAVDVTLTYRRRPLALGTLFDAFTSRAASAAFETTPGVVRELRRLLTARMLDAGFTGYQQEWWHFEHGTQRWAALRGECPRYGPASPYDQHREAVVMPTPDHPHHDLSCALDRVADALADMGAGSPDQYAACWAHSDDTTLFGAWGPIEKGHGPVTRTFEWVGSRFSGGKLTPEYEVIDVSGDLAYTVGFERGTVRVDGAEPRSMTLRVTHVYKRIEDAWHIVHRHADFPPPDQRPRADGHTAPSDRLDTVEP